MSQQTCCPIVELRQYTLVPGGREVLIELFDREFIESQEALGMRIIGQFRDLDRPDRFVWLRGFSDMQARAVQLNEFYSGPVWQTHRNAANTTMIDSDNVFLLQPATPGSGFQLDPGLRPPAAANAPAGCLVIATIYHLWETDGECFAEFFLGELQPRLASDGIPVSASFVTEKHPNTFPALPVREDAKVFVWFSSFPDRVVWSAQSQRQRAAELSLARFELGPTETLFLEPTPRSLLGHENYPAGRSASA